MFYYQLLILCCLFVIWRLVSKKVAKSISEPPELSGRLPIVGHAYMIIGDGVKMYKSLKKISEETLEKGGVITLSLGPRKVYGIADPEDCLTIMNSSLDKHYLYDFLKPLLGNGLFTADGQTWKKNRKLLNPAFSQQVLDSFIGVFNDQAQILVDRFATELGKPFDHHSFLKMNNLETICSTSFGISTEEYSYLLKQYLTRFTRAIKLTNERVQKFWLLFFYLQHYNITQERKKRDIEVKHLLELSKLIIEKKKSQNAKLTDAERNEDKPKTFINIVLDLANDTQCFKDEQIREEIDTIIAAGHDTIASLLTFALTLLGSHIDVQEKAYEEIQALKNTEINIEKNDLSKLVYNEAILKETLRLYPIGQFFPRFINKDVKLKNYTIKANSECFISIYGANRHSIWGPDADQFRPERWLDKETLPDPKYFGAFGLGRRTCIGKAYTMMSMKVTLAHVLRKYRISSDVSKMVVTYELLIRPVSGHHITLALRNK